MHFRRLTLAQLRSVDWRALARPGRGQAALLVEPGRGEAPEAEAPGPLSPYVPPPLPNSGEPGTTSLA